MEFKEVLAARRSCRAFEPDPISPEQVNQLIAAGQWAPSPLNLQPWEFVVVTEPEVKAGLRAAADEARRGVVDQGGPGWTAKYGLDFLEQAPVLVVVLFDPSRGGLGGYFNQPHGALMAASAAIQNLMLAAAEMGLGSLWFTFFDPARLGPVLNLPQNLSIAGIIPLGRPKAWPEAPPRKPARVHWQRHGQEA